MRRIVVIRAFLLGLMLLLLGAVPVDAAEVLQVRTASLLQVGDHNRTYTVELPCLSVPEGGEAAAVAWLRQQLPRRKRVNLRPVGSRDGQLLARVTPIGSEIDLSAGLVAAGLASDRCDLELG